MLNFNSLSDDDYIKALSFRIHSHAHPCGIKTQSGEHVYANEAFKKLVGMHRRDIEGLSDKDMPSETAEYASVFRQQDLDSILQKKINMIFDVHQFASGRDAYITYKSPVILPSGIVFGVEYNMHKCSDLQIVGSKGLLQGIVPDKNFDKKLSNISSKDELVLRMLYQDCPTQSVADELGLSVKTIERHLAKMYKHFSVKGRTELNRYLICNGFASLPDEISLSSRSVCIGRLDQAI